MPFEQKPSTDRLKRRLRIALIVAAVLLTALAWSGVSISRLLASLRERL